MRKTFAVIALVVGVTSVAHAQDPNRGPGCVIDGTPHPASDCGPGGSDPIARYLYPPELIMANQRAIGLSDAQRNAVQQAMTDAQSKFVGLQFKMSSEVESLQRLLQPAKVDEAQVLEQVDRVLGVEREIKRAQLSLMIRIKNVLTPDQQTKLHQSR